VIRAWDGWIDANETWTYASANTITVPAGATSIYAVEDRIKFTQHSVVKYVPLIAVANTLLTIPVNTNYVIENTATYPITLNYYSHGMNPLGYPHWFNYTPTGPTNTTMTGRFSVEGGSVFCKIYGILTGTPAWTNLPTLPIPAANPQMGTGQSFAVEGSGGYFDTGTANYPGLFYPNVKSNATIVTLYANAGAVSTTNPITWANGDQWYVDFNYII
jgi:hypothetical protein